MKINRSLLWICLLAIMAASIAAQTYSIQNRNSKPAVGLNRGNLPMVKPQITKVRNRCFGTCDEYDITGMNFGASQGTKKLLMDGQEQKIMVWKDGQISIGPGAASAVGEHVYHFGIYDQGQLISNDFTQTFLPVIDSISPAQGPKGTKISVYTLTGGTSTQGSKTLKMGAAVMTIVSWSTMSIQALVPPLAPGSYAIEIWNGGQKLTTSTSLFKVL